MSVWYTSVVCSNVTCQHFIAASGLKKLILFSFSGEYSISANIIFSFCPWILHTGHVRQIFTCFPAGSLSLSKVECCFFWKKFSPQSSSYTTNPVYSQRLKLRHFFFLLCRETEWGQEEEPVFIFWSVPWRGCQNRWQGARERWKEKGRGRGEKWGRSKLQAGWQSQGLSVTLQPCMVFARGAALHPAELPQRQAPGEVLSPL